MKEYCKDCDVQTYCDRNPDGCPIAKEYKQIADFEQAKTNLKNELIKSFKKMLDCFEREMKHIKKRLKGGKK